MVNFSSIAIFILGTVQKNNFYNEPYKSYYDSRIVPITNTWGSYFPNLFFVFGTNKFDYFFLEKNCEKKLNKNKRNLIARTPQMPKVNESIVYRCPIYDKVYSKQYSNLSLPESIPNPKFINILYIGNCTGEYFGIGPTCRCQETIRFYMNYNEAQNSNWFMFMDDDVYIRPYSLSSFVNQIEKSYINQPVGLIPSNGGRGFLFSKAKIKRNNLLVVHNCSKSSKHSFQFAQPLLINRDGINKIKIGINSNGLTELQSIWGGSHDSLLGLFLWMFSVPLYSLSRSYSGALLSLKSLKRSFKNRMSIEKTIFIYHKVTNMVSYPKGKKNIEKKVDWPSQYDLASLFGDDLIYRYKYINMSQIDDSHKRKKINHQISSGIKSARIVAPIPNRINQTKYAGIAKNIQNHYISFDPSYC